MKKFLLLAVLATGSYFSHAQTKGTNTIGFGLNFQTQKISEENSPGVQTNAEQRNAGFSLGYGLFIRDNERIGIDLYYGESNLKYDFLTSDLTQNSYGGNLSYQKYYPLLKKFYAFGGGRVGYNYSEGNSQQSNSQVSESSGNLYSLGAYGGATWFISRRLAFEANLLSADFSYNKTKTNQIISGSNSNNTSTNFSLNTAGAINGLGFKIYFLF